MVGVVLDRIIALVGLKEGMVVDMVEGMVDMAADMVAVVAMVVMETLEEVMEEVVQDISLAMADMVMDLGLVDLCMGQLDTEALAMVLLVAMVVLLGMLAVEEDMQVVMMAAGMVGLKALYLSMLKDTTLEVALEVLKHMAMVVLQAEGFIHTGIETFLTKLMLQMI